MKPEQKAVDRLPNYQAEDINLSQLRWVNIGITPWRDIRKPEKPAVNYVYIDRPGFTGGH